MTVEQVLRPLVLQLRLAQPGLGLGDLLRQRPLVDGREQGVPGDRLPELAVDRIDRAADLGGERRAPQRQQIGRQAGAVDHRTRLERQRPDLRDALGGGGRRIRGGLAAAAAGEQRQRPGRQQEGDERAPGARGGERRERVGGGRRASWRHFSSSAAQSAVGRIPKARSSREAWMSAS